MTYRHLLLSIALLLLIIPVYSQDYSGFYQNSLRQNNHAMIVLGTWAATNMVVGAIGWKNNSGEKQYFHQMNFFWNVVNLSIAGFGYYSNITTDIAALTPDMMMDKHKTMETILLVNAGLDVLYMGTGYYLTQRAKSVEKRKSLMKGYGNALMLQGGFLLAFDVIFYTVKHHSRMNFLNQLEPSSSGLGLILRF